MLPDLSALRAAGIELELGEARLVHMLWSRVIADGDGKRRHRPYTAAHAIHFLVTAEVEGAPGECLAPLLADSSDFSYPEGLTAMRYLGLGSADITALWNESATFPTSCLPLRWVLAFLPAPSWPLIAAFISCDSDRELVPRLHEALKRRGNSVSARTLSGDIDAIWLVIRHLVDLRRELAAENLNRAEKALPCLGFPDALDRWTTVPSRPKPGQIEVMGKGGRGHQDTSAVPVQVAQNLLKELARKTSWGKWTPAQWPHNREWCALKRLATLCLLVSVCPRVDHLRLLDVADFDPEHVFGDGSIGPGLRFRREAMKNGRSSDLVYWKRLPVFIGEVLTAWIACSGRRLGQPDAPLLIPGRTSSIGEPGRRYAPGKTLSTFVHGMAGYAPHRFRSTVLQTAERCYATWKLQHPADPLAAYGARAIGELAIDHTVKDLGYRDFTDRQRLEEILALTIELAWNEFWGDGLLNRGIDPEAIIKAHQAVALIEAELQLIEQQTAELEAEDAQILKRSRTSTTKSQQLDVLLASQAINSEIRQKLRRQMKLKDDLLITRAKLEEARTTTVALPDDLEGESYERKLTDALALVEGREQPALELFSTAPIASELTVPDLAELFDVSEMQVRRWRKGQFGPPIEPDQWIEINKKDWRYPVSSIDARALARIPAEDPQAALDTIRRKRGALGFAKRRKIDTKSLAA
ncbi:MAG: hypothetical protein ABSB24_02440 [Gaiellaceae bacterium]